MIERECSLREGEREGENETENERDDGRVL